MGASFSRSYADNAVLLLVPLRAASSSGISRKKKEHKVGCVFAVLFLFAWAFYCGCSSSAPQATPCEWQREQGHPGFRTSAHRQAAMMRRLQQKKKQRRVHVLEKSNTELRKKERCVVVVVVAIYAHSPFSLLHASHSWELAESRRRS
jgi:hypothetical protein